jgi:beta-glucosidase
MGRALLAGVLLLSPAAAQPSAAPPDASRWPSAQPRNPSARNTAADEALIRRIVAQMTLEQKVGQMTQPNIWSVTPDDVRRYYLGSILNGGGAWPGNRKHSSVADWLALSQRFYDASMSTDMPIKIPVIWGTDAVHGHNNVYGATIFPHNIGLGAAHDPELLTRDHLGVRSGRCSGGESALGPVLRKLFVRSRHRSLLRRRDHPRPARRPQGRRRRTSDPQGLDR